MKDFQKDYEERINPALMTRLLAKAVPAIEATGFRYAEVAPGLCKAVLPLNAAILKRVSRLMSGNAHSRLWMDVMHEEALELACGEGRVSEFLRGMAVLGEPFVSGIAENDGLFRSNGLSTMRSATTTDVTGEADNEVYGLYRFMLLRAQPQLTQSSLNGSLPGADARVLTQSERSGHILPEPTH